MEGGQVEDWVNSLLPGPDTSHLSGATNYNCTLCRA